MMTSTRYTKLVTAFLIAIAVVASGATQMGAQVRTGVNPALFSGIYYRPLTVFSRGGRVTAVAGVNTDQQVYYMGSAGGVFKTTDAGVTWIPVTDGQIGVGSIGAIAVADSNPNVVYVGTGTAEPRGNVSNGDGMYRSTDAGKTWQHIGLEKAGLIGRVRVDPRDSRIVYVAAVGNCFGPNKERGVYRTKDGGQTWQQVLALNENTGAVDLSQVTSNPDTIFATMWSVRRQPWSIDSGSMDGGVYRSTDGGDHWSKLGGGLPSNVMVGKIGISVSQSNPKRVYALVEAADNQGGVFRSDDGGDTWTRTNTSRNLQQRAFYYARIYADPVEPDSVYAVNTSAYKSTDGGKTFAASVRVGHADSHDLWINALNNKAMVTGNDGGAQISVDAGQTWSTLNNQATQEIYRVTVDTRWPYWVYGAQQDNSSVGVPSSNVGQPNLNAGPGEAGYIAVDPRNYNVIYAGNYGGYLVRQDGVTGLSEDIRVYADAQTGQRAADMKYRFQWNAPIRLSPHNPDVLYTTSQFVHRSKDGGLNWERISGDLTRNDKTKQDYSGKNGITRDSTGVEVYGTVFSFEESPVTPGLLWAGSDDGLLHLSRNNGGSWEKITPPGLPEFSTINAIDLSPRNPGRAVITAYRYFQADPTPYVYGTSDYGKTWKRLADGKNGIPAEHFTRVVREDPDMPGLLVAGTEYGMYISYDDGGHWQSFQLNLPRVPIMDMMFYRRNLIVATEGRGFWILDDVPVVEGISKLQGTETATLFKPADAYRGGRAGGPVPPPTFNYWFKDEPTAPVTLQVMDPMGAVIYTATGAPGTGTAAQPPSVVPAAPSNATPLPRAGVVGARKGLNVATWTSPMNYPSPYTIPPRIVMWGGGGGQGPRVPPGIYTVKLSMGDWSQTQTFHLGADPRYQPTMTDAEGMAQLKMAQEVGGWVKTLYDNLAKIRDAKQQAADIAQKTPAMAAAAKSLTDKLVAVEGDMTQLQGEAGQDALNFPGRFDNQLTALYVNIVSTERKLRTNVTERYADLKPQYTQMAARWTAVLTTDIAAFNTAATRAGATTIVIK